MKVPTIFRLPSKFIFRYFINAERLKNYYPSQHQSGFQYELFTMYFRDVLVRSKRSPLPKKKKGEKKDKKKKTKKDKKGKKKKCKKNKKKCKKNEDDEEEDDDDVITTTTQDPQDEQR